MEEKHGHLALYKVRVGVVEKTVSKQKPPDIDNFDGKLLRMAVDYIATRIYHIFNLTLEKSINPQT